MIITKIVSSLEKMFLDRPIDVYSTLEHLSALKNERVSFQLALTGVGDCPDRQLLSVSVDGAPAKCSVRAVKNLPVEFPIWSNIEDENYLSKSAGLYPDLLDRLHYGSSTSVLKNMTAALWIELDMRDLPTPPDAGDYEITVNLSNSDGIVATSSFTLTIIDAMLPESELIYTEWFHCDCLASTYDTPVWSERHWQIIENFAKAAVSNGINMLLTPVFTPPLDTAIGGERLTTQLVGVKAEDDGVYSFDFSRVDRWIDMCDRVGIKYFEISHLFTQWGAYHAPKIVADVGGVEKKIFGWDTDARSDDYRTFLRAFLTAFIAHMKARGDDKRCYYHISDEPGGDHLDSYKAAKGAVADLLSDYVIMDALSDYDFYKQGIVETPIPSNNHIAPFIEGGVKDLWTYYCCGQCVDVSNRLIAMPSWRNRSIGMQMFKYDIKGFLQWGYNFYNNMLSDSPIEPLFDVSGEYWVPAGDTCSVYPARDGHAIESLRIIVFYEALQDLSAMRLCASLWGKEKTVAAIEEIFGEVRFDRCATDAATLLAVRERINAMIAEKINEVG